MKVFRLGAPSPFLAVAAAVAVLALGCSRVSDEPPVAGTTFAGSRDQHRPAVDAAVVRGSSHYDYGVKTDAAALAAESTVVFTGSIADWLPAEFVIDHDERLEYAILKVHVTHVVKGSSGTHRGFAYLRLPRGGEVIDEHGLAVLNPGARSTVTTVDELKKAAPVGTRLVFLGNPALPLVSSDRIGSVRNPGTGRPPGVPVLAPAPQGLVFESFTGDVASGVADGEPWGWLPASTPADRRFSLLNQLVRR